MKYLFFLISFLYSFIFYAFWTFSNNKDLLLNDLENTKNIVNLSLKDSIIFSDSSTFVIQSLFWNLLFEVIIFFLIWILLFFYFSKSSPKTDEVKEEDIEEKPSILNKKDLLILSKKFSYYIWFVLFYISFYLISLGFPIISFSFFILIINIVIYIIFFASNFSSLSRNFLKINLIIFSFFYLLNYFFILFTNNNYFTIVDFINSFLILLIFPTLLYFDKQKDKKERFDNTLLVNFSFYIFWVFLFYFYYYLFHQNLVFWICVISTFFWIIWFEYLPKINLFKKDKITLRYIWIALTYIWIVFWLIYLWFFDFSIFVLLVLAIQSFYNLYIHKKYSNYISLFLSQFIIIFLFYYVIINFNLIDYKSFHFLVLGLILSFLIIIYTYIAKFKEFFSYYVIHSFSHIINIFSIIIFFVFNDFDITYTWILLLLESIYFFLSYYKLYPSKK